MLESNDFLKSDFSCPQCGKKFTLPQEVTRHIRDKNCRYDSTISAYYTCNKCPYKTDSQGDYLFHDALHTEPLKDYETKPGVRMKESLYQYKCSICEKFFKKASLRCHVRLHCNERPYVCKICKSGYARKSNLMDHMKIQHGRGYDEDEAQERRLSCSICGYGCERK